MFIERLSTIGFKNIEDSELCFSPGLNCFTGNNGAGKTNILDALYILSMCKSCFSISDYQCIRHGEAFYSLKGYYDMSGEQHNVFCNYSKGRKVVKYNGKAYEKLSDHIGTVPIVMISPKDSELIDGSGEGRRKWMDSVISQGNTLYLKELVRYSKLLLQRNNLLKRYAKERHVHPEEFEMWDVPLAVLNESIVNRRCEFLDDFSRLFDAFYRRLSPEYENVSISYRKSVGAEEDFAAALHASFAKDLLMGYTTLGAQRDDVMMELDGYPVKRVGSQGQKKCFLIALKLAQYIWLEKLTGLKPLLLLDDIFDKLDADRVKKILAIAGEDEFGQIFITDTDRLRIENMLSKVEKDYKLFTVSRGKVTE